MSPVASQRTFTLPADALKLTTTPKAETLGSAGVLGADDDTAAAAAASAAAGAARSMEAAGAAGAAAGLLSAVSSEPDAQCGPRSTRESMASSDW